MATMLLGCSVSQTGDKIETIDTIENQTFQETGPIKLKVWAEENNFEMLNKMIESF